MIEFKIFLRDRDQEYIAASGWNHSVRAIFERDPQYYDEVKARIIIGSEGKASHVFEDNLGPLIQNFCLYGARSIMAGKNHVFRIWSYASEIQINLHDQIARIEGEFCGTSTYPAKELAQALIACAGQAINFLKMVQSKLPQSSEHAIESLEKLYVEVKEEAGHWHP